MKIKKGDELYLYTVNGELQLEKAVNRSNYIAECDFEAENVI